MIIAARRGAVMLQIRHQLRAASLVSAHYSLIALSVTDKALTAGCHLLLLYNTRIVANRHKQIATMFIRYLFRSLIYCRSYTAPKLVLLN
jgi:hypothetical protein